MAGIKDTLKKFGIDHKSTLGKQLETLNIAESWDSVVNIRQSVAHHGQTPTITIGELKKYYQDIRKILGCICSSLTLDQADTSGICSLIEHPTAVSPKESLP